MAVYSPLIRTFRPGGGDGRQPDSMIVGHLRRISPILTHDHVRYPVRYPDRVSDGGTQENPGRSIPVGHKFAPGNGQSGGENAGLVPQVAGARCSAGMGDLSCGRVDSGTSAMDVYLRLAVAHNPKTSRRSGPPSRGDSTGRCVASRLRPAVISLRSPRCRVRSTVGEYCADAYAYESAKSVADARA